MGIEPVNISWRRGIITDAPSPGDLAAAGQPLARKDLPAGAAELSERKDGQPMLTYVCPCGCGVVGVLPLLPIITMGQSGWDWDTSAPDPRTLPTLRPAIERKSPCRWRGTLKAGVWQADPAWAAPSLNL